MSRPKQQTTKDLMSRSAVIGQAKVSVAWDFAVERWIARLESWSGNPGEGITLAFKATEAEALAFAREYLHSEPPAAATGRATPCRIAAAPDSTPGAF